MGLFELNGMIVPGTLLDNIGREAGVSAAGGQIALPGYEVANISPAEINAAHEALWKAEEPQPRRLSGVLRILPDIATD